MAAVQHYARHHDSKRMAVWMLGGGVPKNYTLQGEPLLDQILFVPTEGFDIDVQFCVDPVDNGALSSCPASEGHTWGKVSAECAQTSSVYVHADVTAVFPWLAHTLLSNPKMKRAPRRLMDKLDEALDFLDEAVEKQRRALMKTPVYEGVGE
jgi:deoxyhypusine synthase